MNRNEPTATDVSRAAVDVDMEALGAEKTNLRYVELLEMIKEHFGASCSSQSHTQSHLSIAGEMTETVLFK